MSADAAMRAQVSVRRHAEEVDDFMRDLSRWEDRMKAKDAELRQQKEPKMDSHVPPKVEKPRPKFTAVSETVKEHQPFSVNSPSPDEVLKNKQHAENLKDKGNTYFKAQKYMEAIACYSEGMQNDPHNALLPANRAMAYLKINKYIEAEDDCNTALRLDPTYVKAYLRRGAARMSRQNMKGAEADFAKALEIEPTNKQASEELKKVREKIGQKSASSKIVSKSDAISPEVVERKEDQNHIFPVQKSPESRSKVPLKRIEIKEKGGPRVTEAKKDEKSDPKPIGIELSEDTEKTEPVAQKERKKVSFVDSTPDSGMKEEIKDQAEPEVEQKPTRKAPEKAKPVLDLSVASLPADIPKNIQDFARDWKSISHKNEWKYEYLKRIDPSAFANIFQDFLTCDLFLEMLEVLKTEFVEKDKHLIFPILRGFTHVPRFSLQVMFLDEIHRSTVRDLLSSYTEGVDEAEVRNVREAFDL